MSNYVRYYNNKKQAYRVIAKHWSNWLKSAQLTADDVRVLETTKLFHEGAIRFGLITEFKKLNII